MRRAREQRVTVYLHSFVEAFKTLTGVLFLELVETRRTFSFFFRIDHVENKGKLIVYVDN